MQPKTAQGVPIQVIPGNPAPQPSLSEWNMRRAWWPLAAALVVGILLAILSGASVVGAVCRLGNWQDAASELVAFFGFQWNALLSVMGRGFMLHAQAPWELAKHPVHVLLGSLAFTVCWAYLVARFSSSAFAWLAGSRGPLSKRPPWCVLGMAPLAAVASAIAQEALLGLSLCLHAYVHHGVRVALWLAGFAAALKLIALLGCALLLLVRLAMFAWRGRRPL